MHRFPAQAALALLLISTSKFAKPLPFGVDPRLMQRLQMWVLDKQGRNERRAPPSPLALTRADPWPVSS